LICLIRLILSIGTGGTFHGAGKYIKEKNPNAKIILAEPGAANLVGSGIATERNADGSPAGSHPGKSALVLFYYVNSCAQCEVSAIWLLHLAFFSLYLTAFTPHALT